MFNTKNMQKIFTIIVLLFSIMLSCNKNDTKGYYSDDDCDYYSCNSIEPYYVDIDIIFSRTAENPNPIIYLMSGNFEANNIIDTIFTDSIENYLFRTEISVPLNYNYTVFAEYYDGEDTIVVIDGDFVHKESYVECDSVCWKTYNTSFNVKLKY